MDGGSTVFSSQWNSSHAFFKFIFHNMYDGFDTLEMSEFCNYISRILVLPLFTIKS